MDKSTSAPDNCQTCQAQDPIRIQAPGVFVFRATAAPDLSGPIFQDFLHYSVLPTPGPAGPIFQDLERQGYDPRPAEIPLDRQAPGFRDFIRQSREDDRRRALFSAWRKAKGRTPWAPLGAPLDNRRIFHRDGENPAPVFRSGRSWPHRTECLDPITAEVAEDLYWRQPGRDFAASVAVMPGGILVKNHGRAANAKAKRGGGTRGIVAGFSDDSQRNLTAKLMATDWQEIANPTAGKRSRSGRAIFLTLTYQDDLAAVAPGEGQTFDPARIKKTIDNLGKALKRFPNFQGITWKMEIEDRKQGGRQGDLLPHFHCLVVFRGRQDLAGFRSWIRKTWFRICRGADLETKARRDFWRQGIHVNIVYGQGGRLLTYLVKYMCKTFRHEGIRAGRIWGVIAGIDTDTGEAMTKSQAMIRAAARWIQIGRDTWGGFLDRVRSWASKAISKTDQATGMIKIRSPRLALVEDWVRGFRILGNGRDLISRLTSGLDLVTAPDHLGEILAFN